MTEIKYNEPRSVDTTSFEALVGEELCDFIFQNAPRKVRTRIINSLYHFNRAQTLRGIDDEMGAIRLIAAEEELVVAIFEWLKLNETYFPEHKDFVRKFKNHFVKLSFYPTLMQFRNILQDLLEHGFTLEGLEDMPAWSAKPVVEGKEVQVAIYDNKGEEIIRSNPFMLTISRDDKHGEDVVPLLLADLKETIKNYNNMTLKEFISSRADYRNKLLYASDAGCVEMAETLDELIEIFKETYHDLLWVLALMLGSNPPSKKWGIVSQFIGLYRAVLIEVGEIKIEKGPPPVKA